MDRVVAALGRADRPGRADVVGPGDQGVVAPLAVDPADRVDRRQVDHVEAHRRHLRQPLRGGGEGARARRGVPGRRHRPLGAGEELVPGGEEGPGPVHPQRAGVADGDQLAAPGTPRAARPGPAPDDPGGERQLARRAAPRRRRSPGPLRGRHHRQPPRSARAAPSARSFASSRAPCPAASFLVTASRQVRYGSSNASTAKLHSPTASGRMVACHRSPRLAGRIRVNGRVGAVGPCQTTLQPSASCPSR